MLKTFFTYEQQLNKLQHEKGLIIIPNPASNKRNYSNINRLVNSMKKQLQYRADIHIFHITPLLTEMYLYGWL